MCAYMLEIIFYFPELLNQASSGVLIMSHFALIVDLGQG